MDTVEHSPTAGSSSADNPWDYKSSGTTTDQKEASTSHFSEHPLSSSHLTKEQKRRPKPKDGTSLFCGVCGDKAMGYNFDAVTCESCKAFFRRNATKAKVFTCSFDGNCKMDTHTRKFCSGCRLKKCFEIGMRRDWILNEDQLSKRRQKLRTTRVSHTVTNMPCSSDVTTNVSADNYPTSNSHNELSLTKSDSDEDDDDPQDCLKDIMSKISMLERHYDLCFNAPYTHAQAEKLNNAANANELFNMTDMFIRRLIKFSKKIEEFNQLRQEDQINLLKGGIMEIMVLRSAMGFDKSSEMWKFKTGGQAGTEEKKMDPKLIAKNLGQCMYGEHIAFVKSLHELTRSNPTVMTLLFIIELFSSDRPNLQDKDLVSKGQEKFSLWLRLYMESLYPKSEVKSVYPKLLLKLLDVRNLGEFSAYMASQLDITKLEPLLVEIFSLQK